MYRILRIICCIICALILAACIFIFIYLGPIWGICSVVAAVAFFALTMLFKGLQEDYDKKHNPLPPAEEENGVTKGDNAEEDNKNNE